MFVQNPGKLNLMLLFNTSVELSTVSPDLFNRAP